MVSLRLFATGFLMTRSLALLLLFLFPLAFSPGPGNIFFSAHGAAFGLRRSLRALLGYHLAKWGISVMIGLGLGAILLRHPALIPTCSDQNS